MLPVRARRVGLVSLLALLLASDGARASTMTLSAPAEVDRQAGHGRVGAVVPIVATVTNTGMGSLRIDSAALHFAAGASSVDGQYIVTRPALPATLAAGATTTMTFSVRPWATATAPAVVSGTVMLRCLALDSGSAQRISATTSWELLEGADEVLGQPDFSTILGYQAGMSSPAGVNSDGIRLVVSDSRNNRLLVYSPVPASLTATPVMAIGQPDFASAFTNHGGLGPSSLNNPQGLRIYNTYLVVADTGNNRVLIWNSFPRSNLTPASVVVGQPDFSSGSANAGGNVSARSLNGPLDAHILGGKLVVADTGNHRVLIWNTVPSTNYAPADVVLGQGTFLSNLPNDGSGAGNPTAWSLKNPGGVWYDGVKLFVADSGNNRVLGWNSLPAASFTSASFVLGQNGSFSSGVPNFNVPPKTGPHDNNMTNPTCVNTDGNNLYVTDKGNNRVLVYVSVPSDSSHLPQVVVGNFNFTTNNTPPAPPSAAYYSGPGTVFSDGLHLYVCDSGENRVLLYSSIPTSNGANAEGVLGQNGSFGGANANDPGILTAQKLNTVRAAVAAGGSLYAVDQQNRVLVYARSPSTNNAAATSVVGQGDFAGTSPAVPTGGPPPSFPTPNLFMETLNTPLGLAVDHTGKVLIADELDDRVLVFNGLTTFPGGIGPQASVTIGQPTSTTISVGPASQTTIKDPVDVACDGTRVAIAESKTNRVLLYNSVPAAVTGAAANVVVGQSTFTASSPNAGNGSVVGTGLTSPGAVELSHGELFIADTGNNRVLLYNSIPTSNGTAASIVLGQANATSNTAASGPSGLHSPLGIAFDGQRLAVCDQGNNRVLLWNSLPTGNAQPPDTIIGQASTTDVTPNRSEKLGAFGLNQPRHASWESGSLWVTDGGNFRALRFDFPQLTRVRVSAGVDRTAPASTPIVLTAAVSGSPVGPVSYRWTQLDGPPAAVSPAGGTSRTVTFTPSGGGMHTFRVSVTDSGPVTGLADVHVLVDSPPIVPAMPNLAINPAATVQLNAQSSYDPDGDAIAYQWQMLGVNSGVPITNATSAVASFEPSPGTTYSLELSVSDGNNGVTTRQFSLAVRRDPFAVLFAPATAGGNQKVTLDGSTSSDPDGGRLSYLWQRTGPSVALLPSATAPVVTFTTPGSDSTLGFLLTVSNPNGGTATAAATIAVHATPPTAILRFPQGTNATVKGPFGFQVDFSEPMDMTTPVPAVSFIRTAGTGVLTTGPLQRRVDDTNNSKFEYDFSAGIPQNGTYVIVLSGRDSFGNALVTQPAGNALAVNVANGVPAALALGPTQRTTGSAVPVDGSHSSDPDGDSITYRWSGTGPGSTSVAFTDPTSAKTTFTPLVAGTYVISLVVTDPFGAASPASGFSVSVSDSPANQPPVASAGADQFLARGQIAHLSGSASDPDGDPLSYAWSLATVPAGSQLSTGTLPASQGGNSAAAFFTPDLPGTYGLEFTAADNRGADTLSTMRVVVNDHAGSIATLSAADALPTTGGVTPATFEGPGDVDFFSLQTATGKIYSISVRCVTATSAEATLFESDGVAVLAQGVATAAGAVQLPDYQPPVSGPLYLRVRSPSSLGTGTYQVIVAVRPAVLQSPPALSLASGVVSGQLEATVSTAASTVPLSFLEFLVDYDASSLTLVGRTPESAATGFSVQTQQFSLPYIDTVLEANGQPRPIQSGPLLTLQFEVAPGALVRANSVEILLVSATPPPPLNRVAVLRPTADAGVSLNVGLVPGGLGRLGIPDPLTVGQPIVQFVRLDGRASSDPAQPPRKLVYRWSLEESPVPAALDDPTAVTPRVTPLAAGRYRAALVVSNGVLAAPTAEVSVLVQGSQNAPAAQIQVSSNTSSRKAAKDAGATLVAQAGTTVTLDGTSSTDLDASARAALTYSWSELSGPFPISLPHSAVVTFAAEVAGTYVFELDVRAPSGLAATPAQVTVIVPPPNDDVPLLSITAISSTTGYVGHDLGEVPELASDQPLRVPAGAQVSLQARATDSDFAAGRQLGLFYWRQVSGPVDRTGQQDSEPAQSRLTFSPAAAGVRTYECRLVEADLTSVPLGPEVVRSIRVAVDEPARPVPQAVARTTATATVGATVALDGGAAAVAPGLTYRWTQVQGPPVHLSDPFSPVTTFVAPDLGEAGQRDYSFQLFADAGSGATLRSPPAVATVAIGRLAQQFQLSLVPGSNLVGLPLDPSPPGARFTLADLARVTGAGFVAQEGPSGRWQAYIPGLGAPPPDLSGSAAYLIVLAGASGSVVPFSGQPWPRALASGFAVSAGLGSVALPDLPARGTTTDNLTQALSARYLIGTAGGKFVLLLPAAQGGTPQPLATGAGFLYRASSARTVDLGPLLVVR